MNDYEKQMQDLVQAETEKEELESLEHAAELDELLLEAERQSDLCLK